MLLQGLNHRYAFERELGHGGMATVYLARDLLQDSLVAIKVLQPELVPILGIERFAREIRITATLKHPGILPVLDSGEVDGLPYYVTPYIAGESLAARLEQEHQISIDQALDIACQVADALDAAHHMGFVHRDVKPSNILLRDGQALLTDFGIARAVDVVTAEKLTESGVALGTPSYMSPEQSACGHIDGRSDIYSLGCVLYEMLAGTPPFGGPTPQSVRARHAVDLPPPIRTVRPTVSPALEQAIDKALAKVPSDRYHSAGEMAQALKASGGSLSLWRRLVLERHRIMIAALLLLFTTGIWVLAARPTETLDPNKVVVFPLVQRAGSLARAGLGEEVALLIGSALEHSDPLKWIDGWTWLDAPRRTNMELLDASTARRIARDRRARYYIDGVLASNEDSTAVILRLNDARGDSLVAQSTVTGTVETVAQAGLEAISQLLPRLLAPGRRVDFAPLRERRPGAIANWLQGEREYRKSQFVRALEYYQSAVKIDPALALAAVKGAQAADWMGLDDDAKRLLAVALEHRHNLPPKYTHLARGLQSFLTGEADSAAMHYRQALSIDPVWAEAWTALGDVYFHLLPPGSAPDSVAETAFNEARHSEPDFIPALLHLTEIAVVRGDLPRARAMLAEFRKSAPDRTWIKQLELMLACRSRGPRSIDWATEVRTSGEEVFYAAKALTAQGAAWDCTETALRELLRSDSIAVNYQRASLLLLQSMMVARGRYTEAEALIDSAVSHGETAARGLYLVDAVAGAPFDGKAKTILAGLSDGIRTLEAPRLWFLASWYAHTGEVSQLAAVVKQLEVKAASDPQARLLADAMNAKLSLAKGDTALARDQLLALRPTAARIYITWGLWQSLAAERMALAEILLAQREPARAIEIASGFDHFEPVVYLLYLPRSLALRERAARSMGRSDLARRYADRLRALGRQEPLEKVLVAQVH